MKDDSKEFLFNKLKREICMKEKYLKKLDENIADINKLIEERKKVENHLKYLQEIESDLKNAF